MPPGVQHLAARGPVGFSWLTTDMNPAGVLGDPRSATADKGWAWLEPTIDKLAGVLEEIATFEMPTVGVRAAVR
jgi:creatinine amidohydrolase